MKNQPPDGMFMGLSTSAASGGSMPHGSNFAAVTFRSVWIRLPLKSKPGLWLDLQLNTDGQTNLAVVEGIKRH